jgi:ubiquitin-like domain-containing CTD phosphatase 1
MGGRGEEQTNTTLEKDNHKDGQREEGNRVTTAAITDMVELKVSFRKEVIVIRLPKSETVGSVKRELEKVTRVSVSKQKILGLKGAVSVNDETVLDCLDVDPKKKIMLLGTPEDMIQQVYVQEEIAPHVQELEEDEEEEGQQACLLLDRPEIQEKLAKRVAQAQIKELNAPRDGAKCVVFDIDYTFFDLSGTGEVASELLRPHTVELFTKVYECGFDIVIWSANSMKWIFVKLKELGLLDHPGFKITACMDFTAMVTVDSSMMTGEDSVRMMSNKKKKRMVWDCKPLHVLWQRYPQTYSPSRTIMIDDLRRNFVMNVQNGLVIKPFRKRMAKDDREFLKLIRYLSLISALESFEELNHDEWKDYIATSRITKTMNNDGINGNE